MSDPRTRSVRTSFERVQAILHAEWDPIGCGVPLDEYDSYAWPVLKLLQAGASRDAVENFLREAATAMVSPMPEARLRATVDQLMDLKVDSGG